MGLAQYDSWPTEGQHPLARKGTASAVAVQLARRCHHVILCHDPFPPVIRRGMAFHDALFKDSIEVDGIIGARAETAAEISSIIAIPDRWR